MSDKGPKIHVTPASHHLRGAAQSLTAGATSVRCSCGWRAVAHAEGTDPAPEVAPLAAAFDKHREASR